MVVADNDPLVEAATPTLTATFPKIESNLYKISFTHKKYFESISVNFGDSGQTGPSTDCQLVDSDYASQYWTKVNEDVTNCQDDALFQRNVQNMLGNCGFSSVSGVFSNIVTVTTKQNRTLSGGTGASAGRTQNYYQIKDIEFQVQVTIPTSIEVNSTAQVFGNVTVLKALLNQYINVSATDGSTPTLQFDLQVSSQYPYQLTWASAAQGDTASNTGLVPQIVGANVVSTTPDCIDPVTNFPTECIQTFQFNNILIGYTGTACTLDTSNYKITFNVGCTANFTAGAANGGCNTPNPSSIDVFIDLTSSNYCAQTDTFTPVPSVTTYKDDTRTEEQTEYVVGSTVYGKLNVSIPSLAVTITDVRINKITTDGFGDDIVIWNTDNTPAAIITDVQVDEVNPSSHAAWFEFPLINGVTVGLDNNNEAAQGVVISVDGTVIFQANAAKELNGITKDWAHDNSARSAKIRLQNNDRSRGVNAESLASIAPATTTVAPAGSSGSSASTSSILVVAAIATVAVVAAVVAFRRGRQTGATNVAGKRSNKESVQLGKSSSTVELETV